VPRDVPARWIPRMGWPVHPDWQIMRERSRDYWRGRDKWGDLIEELSQTCKHGQCGECTGFRKGGVRTCSHGCHEGREA